MRPTTECPEGKAGLILVPEAQAGVPDTKGTSFTLQISIDCINKGREAKIFIIVGLVFVFLFCFVFEGVV